MSKSVREQIGQGTINVEHKGLSRDIDLPVWICATANVLDSPDDLIKTLADHDQLLGVLHQGLAQSIINVRAAARRYDNNQQACIDPASGLKHQAPQLPKPGTAKKGAMTPEQALDALSPEQLQALLKDKGLA